MLLLLKHGASVSVLNGDGRLAAAVSSDEYISSLLRAAAGTERRIRQQRLMRAASDGLTTVVDRMVSDGDGEEWERNAGDEGREIGHGTRLDGIEGGS